MLLHERRKLDEEFICSHQMLTICLVIKPGLRNLIAVSVTPFEKSAINISVKNLMFILLNLNF